MDIDSLTIGQAKQLAKMIGATSIEKADTGGFEIGKNYLIRTVTHIQTGLLVAVGEKELVLEEAAWIADTGRFSGALKDANFNEVEPFPTGKVIVGRGALIDAVQILTLPRSQK